MTLVIIAIVMIGTTSIPQDAYAQSPPHCSPGETSIKVPVEITSVVPTLDGAEVEWTQAELDADFSFFIFTFHLDCDFPTFFEVELQDPTVLLDDTIPGGPSGTYTITGLECGTDYTFDVDGLWDTPFYGPGFLDGLHIDGVDTEFTTLDCPTEKTGGFCTQCQHPSLGLDNRGTRVVDGGITVNGETHDALFYHTPTELIQADLDTVNTVKLKIWDDRLDNIKHVKLGFGMGKIGESFSQVEYSMVYDRNLLNNEVTITSDEIFTDVHVIRLADEPCRVGTIDCTVIEFSFRVTEPIVGDVVFGTDIWDKYNNADTHFFNDGMSFGTEADVVIEEPVDTTVYKTWQVRTDDGLGNIDSRYSEAFAKKAEWNMQQIDQIVAELGY